MERCRLEHTREQRLRTAQADVREVPDVAVVVALAVAGSASHAGSGALVEQLMARVQHAHGRQVDHLAEADRLRVDHVEHPQLGRLADLDDQTRVVQEGHGGGLAGKLVLELGHAEARLFVARGLVQARAREHGQLTRRSQSAQLEAVRAGLAHVALSCEPAR